MKLRKKLAAVIAGVMVMSAVPAMSVSAYQIGEKLGNVVYSDIKAYINGNRISCYAVNGYMAIVTADLKDYGFDVVYNDAARASYVTFPGNKTATPPPVSDLTGKTGAVAFPYVYTDIVSYVNGKKVDTFAISGKLVIYLKDLDVFGSRVYDDLARTTKLTTNPSYSGFSVSGRVSDGLTGVSAIVQIKDVSGRVIQTSNSGTNGSYTFTKIPQGTCYVEATATGYTMGVTGTFAVNQNVADKNIVLVRSEYSVSGTITAADTYVGIPATVRLINASTGVAKTTTAASNGTYSFAAVPAGNYTIEAAYTGYTSYVTALFAVQNAVASKNVALERSGNTISGRVTDASTGVGIPATLKLRTTTSSSVVQTVTADTSGYYTFIGVTNGNYTIEASYVASGVAYATQTTAAFALSTSLSGVTSKNITLSRMNIYTISGIVTFTNSASAYYVYPATVTARINSPTGTVVGTASTNVYGEFSLSNLTVTPSTQGTSVNYYLSVTYNGVTYQHPTYVQLSSSYPASSNIYIYYTSTLNTNVSGAVTVTGSDWTNIGVVTVTITGNGISRSTTVNSYSNVYIFTDVPVGTYTITAASSINPAVTRSITITVNSLGTTSADIALTNVVSGATITGLVIHFLPAGTPVTVMIEGTNYQTYVTTTTSYYTFSNVPVGTYLVTASAGGYYDTVYVTVSGALAYVMAEDLELW